jgi:hypothetical protein
MSAHFTGNFNLSVFPKLQTIYIYILLRMIIIKYDITIYAYNPEFPRAS